MYQTEASVLKRNLDNFQTIPYEIKYAHHKLGFQTILYEIKNNFAHHKLGFQTIPYEIKYNFAHHKLGFQTMSYVYLEIKHSDHNVSTKSVLIVATVHQVTTL